MVGLDSRVSKVVKAEKGVLGFPVPQVNPAATVKRVLKEDPDPQDCLELQAAQVPQVGKETKGTGVHLDQLE